MNKRIKDIYIEECQKHHGETPQIGRRFLMIFKAIELYVELKMDQAKKPVSTTLESGCGNIPERPCIITDRWEV